MIKKYTQGKMIVNSHYADNVKYMVAGCGLIDKVNELVDAVNGILDYAPLEMAMKAEPVDPYAEQKMWVGKLCKFWDDDENIKTIYGVLTNIDDTSFNSAQYCCNDEYEYDHCEPVKPDDPIIYKGE